MNPSSIFLTDEEFEELFGTEIAGITRALNETGTDKCSACKGKCCMEIGCGLYSEKFTFCPIYDIRPRECRYHFCNSILGEAPLSAEAKELLEKPIQELLDSDKARLSELFTQFPQFPLDSQGLASLGIKEEVNNIIQAFEESELDEYQARGLLKSLCLDAAK